MVRSNAAIDALSFIPYRQGPKEIDSLVPVDPIPRTFSHSLLLPTWVRRKGLGHEMGTNRWLPLVLQGLDHNQKMAKD